jgi:pantoate--beta-alanine ligase
VREADGLALSSRNAYLSAEERARAPTLYSTLQDVAKRLRGGGAVADAVAAGRAALISVGFAVDYLEVRNAETLAPVTSIKGEPLRVLVAAKLGRTRLIDNIAV